MRGVGPLLSVIVLNYNGSRIMDVMREGIDSLRAMGYEDYELIFVDNGSSDGSYEAMSRYLEGAGLRRYSVIEAGRNLGFTGGNNLGFANQVAPLDPQFPASNGMWSSLSKILLCDGWKTLSTNTMDSSAPAFSTDLRKYSSTSWIL